MSSGHLRQRGFGLGQPEGHVHSAVQLDSGRQGGARHAAAGEANAVQPPALAPCAALSLVQCGEEKHLRFLPPRPTRSGLPVDVSQL
jgi:hypothetical protein